jgi:hypothetical protein
MRFDPDCRLWFVPCRDSIPVQLADQSPAIRRHGNPGRLQRGVRLQELRADELVKLVGLLIAEKLPAAQLLNHDRDGRLIELRTRIHANAPDCSQDRVPRDFDWSIVRGRPESASELPERCRGWK